jgi:hypothetical protein
MEGRTRTHHTIMLGVATAVLALGMMKAAAQPCASVTVRSIPPACGAVVNFWTTPPNSPPPFFIASGATLVVPIPAGATVLGMISLGLNSYPLAGPPFAPGAPAGATMWVPHITLGPAPGCCFDVYFQFAPTCNVWLYPSSPLFPPPCQP